MLILVQSCTGQKPAELKNSTAPKRTLKASCSNMKFEGQVLSKQNILNIFECSGWDKQYPDLTVALKNSEETSVNQAFKVVNDSFFSSKDQRKTFYETIAEAESRGELDVVSKVLEKGLTDHTILAQVDNALNKDHMNLTERSDFMKVLSGSNDQNLKIVRALKHVVQAFEKNKSRIHELLSEEEKSKLVPKARNLLNDFSKSMDSQSWSHLSKILYEKESALQRWAYEGQGKDLSVLLKVIEQPGFYEDVKFLKNSLDTGITCTNKASTRDFNINVAQELKQKIEGLKTKNRDEFGNMLLHGLTKYLAFQEFCEEKTQAQGLESFFVVLKSAFAVLPSDHDYRFLKKIHQLFGDDRYVFLSFLSSSSFKSLRELLVDLEKSGADAEFVAELYEILLQVSPEDLQIVAELVQDISRSETKTAVWQKSWSKLWDGLSASEKDSFIQFLGLFLSEDVNASGMLNTLEQLMTEFPEFSQALANKLNEESFQNSLRYLIHVMSEKGAQKDLSVLLSEKGLFEFIEILTQEYEKPVRRAEALEPVEHDFKPYGSSELTDVKVQTKVCFESLSKNYQIDTDYYNLVNNLPESCLNTLGEVGFVGQIYLWMYHSEQYFRNKGVDDFHSVAGVWAPGMLQFIFASAVKADFALISDNGKKGILNNLDSIHRDLVDPRLLESIHQLSLVYKTVDTALVLEPRLLRFIESKSDKVLNQLTKDGFVLLKKTTPVVDISFDKTECSDISPDLGANPCLDKQEIKDQLVDMLRIMRRPNEKNVSIAKELVKWLHPEGGVALPFGKKPTHVHKASVDEVIRFLNDLSNENTSKKFTYQTREGSKAVSGTVLDRLEVVIRDISFNNNFYGAFFKNDVAGAKDYRKDVIASEKLLVMLDNSGGIFRTFGGMPKDSKTRLKNVRATYSSLIEVSDEYKQADGSVRNYGAFTQGLLAIVANSSKLSTQDFNPYRVPSEKVVEGHNGWFLTKATQLSGLRHLSSFVRAHFDEELSALDTEAFKKINANLIARHDLIKIQNGTQRILDKYLDADKKQINLMISDAVDFVNSLNPEEQKVAEEIVVKSLMLLSEEKISTSNLEKMSDLIEMTIRKWPEISNVLSALAPKRLKFLSLINEMLDGLVKNPEELNRLISTLIESDLISIVEIEKLLEDDKTFQPQLISLLNQLIDLRDMETDLNWNETLSAILTKDDFEWDALKAWFQVALGQKPHKLSVSLLIETLGEKKDGVYMFKTIMDELFYNHKNELKDFLKETFKALELKPE